MACNVFSATLPRDKRTEGTILQNSGVRLLTLEAINVFGGVPFNQRPRPRTLDLPAGSSAEPAVDLATFVR